MVLTTQPFGRDLGEEWPYSNSRNHKMRYPERQGERDKEAEPNPDNRETEWNWRSCNSAPPHNLTTIEKPSKKHAAPVRGIRPERQGGDLRPWAFLWTRTSEQTCTASGWMGPHHDSTSRPQITTSRPRDLATSRPRSLRMDHDNPARCT